MKKNNFIKYIYVALIVIICIVYLVLDHAGAQLDMAYNRSSRHDKEYTTSRANPDDFITIKHQPTRYYHTHKPQEYIIMNYASSRNTLGGTHRVDERRDYDEEGKPWIKKSLEKEGGRANKKKLHLRYDAAGGEVEYVVTFKNGRKFEQYNTIGGKIQGTASPLRIGLVVGKETYYYDYLGLADEWQELTIPYESFEGLPIDKITSLEALKLIVVGKFQRQTAGEIFFDELKLYKYSPDDLERLKGIMEEQRMAEPEDYIRALYAERDGY
ncbi:MAG: hypothetical protein JW938_03865 [Candidatus Omnitrophica bacterium]|nr:hypothetical protein [Candidatus Omnitrophota bacterium]